MVATAAVAGVVRTADAMEQANAVGDAAPEGRNLANRGCALGMMCKGSSAEETPVAESTRTAEVDQGAKNTASGVDQAAEHTETAIGCKAIVVDRTASAPAVGQAEVHRQNAYEGALVEARRVNPPGEGRVEAHMIPSEVAGSHIERFVVLGAGSAGAQNPRHQVPASVGVEVRAVEPQAVAIHKKATGVVTALRGAEAVAAQR